MERALIKLSSVASGLTTQLARTILEALIAGQRDPKTLADLAIGKMRARRKDLAAALEGRFEAHHAELARMLLNQIDARRRRSTPSAPASASSSRRSPSRRAWTATAPPGRPQAAALTPPCSLRSPG